MNGNWDTRISRRTLLRTGGAAAIVLYGGSVPSASAGPKFTSNPFTLGVASGEPTPDGIVLGYCPEAVNPARTILGEEQRGWLIDGLVTSPARWNVLANQVRFAPTDTDANLARRAFGDDNWDNYVADRQEILDAIQEHHPANPIVITGDAHIHAVRNVPPDFENFDAPPVATEFIGTSISSMQGNSPPSPPVFEPDPNNPHRLFQCNQRGYVSVEVTPGTWRSEHRVVDALQEHAEASVIATFVVEDGDPRAIQEFPTPTDGGFGDSNT
jgi:alkaline phosphatase D